jgi:RNA polymerase sigma-70 factor (ECF subfamily)
VARATWPRLAVGAEDLAAHLGARAEQGRLPSAEHAGDMLLACGCVRGLCAALSAFHDKYDAVIARVLARRTMNVADAADVAQVVYERLLVHRPGHEPKLSAYCGTGPLRSWVSTVSAKTALTIRRSERRRRTREGYDPETLGAVVAALSPELLYLKRAYHPEIELAVQRALGNLDDHAGALLRLHLGQRLSIDHLGTMYGVNRSTAARWIVSARDDLARAIRSDLRQHLKLSESDYQSLMGLVRSQLDVTVADLLRPEPPSRS